MAETNCVIFDVDGTLSDCSHRVHHIEARPKNWTAFNAAIGRDAPNVPIITLARLVAGSGKAIVICTGRDQGLEAETRDWLTRHQVPHDAIYMRPAGSRRDDDTVKRDLFGQITADGYVPLLVVEDRERVVTMWRSLGLTCLQCAPGKF